MSPSESERVRRPVELCRLCGAEAPLKFTLALSRGLTGHYFECEACHFLRSDHLDDAAVKQRVYDTARSDDDPGAAYRQLCIALRLTQLVRARLFSFGPSFRMLDFGAATGFLSGSLAPRFGWNTVGYDAYAKPFYDPDRVTSSWKEASDRGPFDLVIATEVLEHFTDPLSELGRIAGVMGDGRSFLYATTTLYDPKRCGGDWTYLAPHTAQHCAFYSREALAKVASALGAEVVSLSGTHANEWLFVRGGAGLRLQARAAGWIIRELIRRGRIPEFH